MYKRIVIYEIDLFMVATNCHCKRPVASTSESEVDSHFQVTNIKRTFNRQIGYIIV